MLFIGTGAVASFLAGRISTTGQRFQFFGAPSDRLHSLSMRFHTSGVSQGTLVEAHRLWVVAVKAWQNPEKVQALSVAPPPEAILVLQNGLCPEEDWKGLPGAHVERGLSTYGVKSEGPGLVAGGQKGVITLSKSSAFSASLTLAGLQVQQTDSMRVAIWHKLAVNASLNVVAALFGLTNGQVLQYPEVASMMRQAALEVSQVARAVGVDWGRLSAWEMARQVAEKTSNNVCSTLADIRLGRPTEYQSINGEILSLAREHGVDTPILDRLDRMFTAGQTSMGATSTPMPTFRARLPALDSRLGSYPQLKAARG